MDPPLSSECCTGCGRPLPGGRFGSSCPGCLLELALTPDPGGGGNGHHDLPRYFADHEVLGEIARGGMGTVYRARRLGIDREVALKVVRTGSLATPDARLRFALEVEAVSKLQHPGIVTLYETGEAEGVHYFSMPVYPGGTLADALPSLGLRARVALLAGVADAAHHAHSRGILHRDIKPSNILLDKRGEPVLTDFGLVKHLDHASDATVVRTVLGSPHYMAPEQAAGGGVTTASDIFSLGVVLGEVLGEGRAPRDLRAVQQRCVEEEPSARYTSAAALAADLRRWLVGEPVHARPRGVLPSVWLWARRSPALASALVACAVLVAALAVGSTIAALRITRAERAATANLRALQLEKVDQLAAAGRGRDSVELLEQVVAAGPDDLVNARHLASALGHRSFPTLTEPRFRHPPRVVAAGWAEESVTTLAADGTVKRWPLDGEGVGRSLPPVPWEPATAAFSPGGGTMLAVGKNGSVALWREGDEAVRVLMPEKGVSDAVFSSPAISPGSRYAGARTGKTTVCVWDTATGGRVAELEGYGDITAWAFSPDEEWAALACRNASCLKSLSDPGAGKLLEHAGIGHPTAIEFSPDGNFVAAAGGGGEIVFWGTARGEAYPVPRQPQRNFRHVAFSPDGQTLAAVDLTGRADLYSVPGGALLAHHFGGGSACSGLAFDDTGTRLALAMEGNAVQLFHVPSGRPLGEPALTSVGALASRFVGEDAVVAVAHDGVIARYELVPPPMEPPPPERLPIARNFGHRTYAQPSSIPPFAVGGTSVSLTDTRLITGVCGNEEFRIVGEGAPWRATANRDGTRLATATSSGDVHIWDLPSGEKVAQFSLGTLPLHLAFNPAGTRLATADRSMRTTTWDTATGEPAGPDFFKRRLTFGLAYTPDGKRILLATPRRVHLIDPATGEPTWTRPHRSQIYSATLSPDGETVAVALADGTAALHRTTAPVGTPPARIDHGAALFHAAFSPSGEELLTAAFDGTLRLWHLPTRRPLTILLHSRTSLAGAGFTADGTRILATTEGGGSRIWEIPVAGATAP